MRIALVCPYSLDVAGGVGKHVLGLAGWLQSMGHEPTVIAPGSARAASFPIHTLGASVPIRFNGSTARLALGASQRREAWAVAAAADVVHVHEPLTPGVAYAVARRAPRLVVTHHAHFLPGWALGAALRWRAARLGARVSIAVSAAANETVGRFALPAEVIPNAIVPPAASGLRRERLGVFIGRKTDSRKGYAIFRDVRERLEGEVDFVEFSDGRASEGELAEALQRASFLFAPNLGGESFGVVLVEALASGAGIVGSRLPAFRAVVDDPRVVRWFEPGSVSGAVAAVRALLGQGVGESVARGLAKPFSWAEVGPRILRQYELALLG